MHTKPKILILSTAYLPHIGGSELAVHHIAQRATDYDFDVVTARLDNADSVEETIGRVRVYRIGRWWTRMSGVMPKPLLPFAIALKALRLMRVHRYTAVHAYQASQAGLAGVLVKCAHPSVPFIVTLQEGKDLGRQSLHIQLARELILRWASVVTVISQHLERYARGITRAPVHLIPNGVDIASMRLPDTPRESGLILTVSRLVEKNNVAGLIRALRYVRERIPEARLVVIGSGPLRGELETLASELGVAGAVEFIGALPHMGLTAWFARASVFARPSLSEGLGSAFLEAMAARVPVVASPVGGIPDIIHHESTGLLCDPYNPRAIADAVVRLMVDIPFRDRMINEAHRFVQAYDWNAIAKRMEGIYRFFVTP